MLGDMCYVSSSACTPPHPLRSFAAHSLVPGEIMLMLCHRRHSRALILASPKVTR